MYGAFDIDSRPPPIFPNGVRAAPRITVLGIWSGLLYGDRKPYPPGRHRVTMRRALLIAMVALALSPGTAGAQGVDLTCQFALTRLDHTTTNVLALDTNAVYWASHYVAVPGSRIRIEGHYPFARYFSWNVYDAAGRPIDAMNDAQPPARPGIAGDVHRLDRVGAGAAESRPQPALQGRPPRRSVLVPRLRA